MSHVGHITEIVYQNKWRIGFTYLLLVSEFVMFALIPFLMGKAIDSLLKNSFDNFYFYLSISIAAMFIGVFRRRFDTRTFVRIWHSKTYSAICYMIGRNVDSSKIISRAGLARTYGDFLEYTLPAIINAVIDLVIAIIMIWMVVPVTAYQVAVMVLLTFVVQYWFSIALRKIEIEEQKVRENNDAAIVQKDVDTILEGHKKLMKLMVRGSDIEASCWRLVELLGIIAEVMIVFALVQSEFTAGMIMSTVAYGHKVFEKTNFMNFLYSHIRQMQVAEKFMHADSEVD